MKALLLNAPRDFRQIETDEPARPGPGEALVRVHSVGICGTDIAGYLGKMPFFSYPRIPGHELGVEVLEVGPGVENVQPGDHCAVEPYINCQRCHACLRGKTNCCEKHQTLGVHCDGGLRPRFVVPARKLHVSKSLAFEQLALVETLAIGCHAVDRGAPGPDESCHVNGAGPIGLATLEFAKLTGSKTIVVDVNPQRLEFCRERMGITHTITLSDRLETDLRDLTDGHSPDVVIDATGNSTSMSSAFGYVGHGGRLVFVGITTDEVRFQPSPSSTSAKALYFARGTHLPATLAVSFDSSRTARSTPTPGSPTGADSRICRASSRRIRGRRPASSRPWSRLAKFAARSLGVIRSAVTVSLVAEARGGPFDFWHDLPAACRKAKALGFDAIEVFPPGPDALKIGELRTLLDDHGLALAAVGTGAGWVKHRLHLASADPRPRTARAFIRSMIDFAGPFGAPAIIGSMQGRSGDGVDRRRPQRLTYGEAAGGARGEGREPYGVPVIFEPLNRYETDMVNTIEAGVDLLRPLSTRNVVLLADLFHMNIEEADLASAIRRRGRGTSDMSISLTRTAGLPGLATSTLRRSHRPSRNRLRWLRVSRGATVP